MRLPKFRLGLRVKITAYISLVVIFTATVLGWFLVRREAENIAENLKEKGQILGRNVASASEYGVLTGDKAIFDSIIAGLEEEDDFVYCIIYNSKGETLARTEILPLPHMIEGISPTMAYEVTEKALKANEVQTNSFTRDETKTPVYDIAAPIVTRKINKSLSGEEVIFGVGDSSVTITEKIGIARIGVSLDSMKEEIRQAGRTIRVVTATVVLLAIGLTIFLVRVIVDPVQQLVAATERVASGDLDKPVSVMTNDEIGELGVSFNKMIADLKRYRVEIEEYSRTLEQKVEERTKILRLTNEELERTNKQLAEVSKLKSEFLANVSHELRTPLNAIIGFSEILRDQSFGELNEKQHRYADNVVSSGKHLLQLINEILDLAKVESGKMTLNLETFTVAGVLAETANSVRALASKKDITIRQHLSPKLTTLTADPKKFKQILYNLLSNAIKFTPDKGWIEISTEIMGDFEVAGEDEVVFRRYAEFCVKDNGIGIDEEDQERIFKEFQQVDGSYAREYEGTGLGLALTKKLVELHGGSIWMQSEKDKGSAFYFTIPVLEQGAEAFVESLADEEPEPTPLAMQEDSPGKGVVLVVEDDPHSFELISMYLQEEGYEVAHASDGEQAIELARSVHPAIIALDIILPDRDGWSVLQELKSAPETDSIPVIIVSVLQDEEMGFSMGAADYIVKPVSRPDLLERVEKLRGVVDGKKISDILVIEDDKEFSEILIEMLEGEAFSVAGANTGLQGIEHATKQRPDLIFLDLMLPDLSGFEVVEFLKMEESTKDIPIIVVTSKELSEGEKQSLNGKIEAAARKGHYGKQDFLDEVRRVERLATTRKEEA